jgi:hypothetical protein
MSLFVMSLAVAVAVTLLLAPALNLAVRVVARLRSPSAFGYQAYAISGAWKAGAAAGVVTFASGALVWMRRSPSSAVRGD